MTFRAGQKVVCVDAGHERNARWTGDIPREGGIYTVAGVVEIDLGIGLMLEEIVNHPEFQGSYRASRFRPAVERKTDISIFQRMLLPQGVEA